MPDAVDLQLKNIQSKLQTLLKSHSLLQKENEKLSKENSLLKSKEAKLSGETEVLQQQVYILKSSATKMEGKEKAEFEKRINRYLRTIDKCITLLNG